MIVGFFFSAEFGHEVPAGRTVQAAERLVSFLFLRSRFRIVRLRHTSLLRHQAYS